MNVLPLYSNPILRLVGGLALVSCEGCEHPGGLPAYLRGLAYLQNKQGAEAAGEFQKIVDNRMAFGPWPYVSLARLGLGRAYVLSGDPVKARVAYQDFFML